MLRLSETARLTPIIPLPTDVHFVELSIAYFDIFGEKGHLWCPIFANEIFYNRIIFFG